MVGVAYILPALSWLCVQCFTSEILSFLPLLREFKHIPREPRRRRKFSHKIPTITNSSLHNFRLEIMGRAIGLNEVNCGIDLTVLLKKEIAISPDNGRALLSSYNRHHCMPLIHMPDNSAVQWCCYRRHAIIPLLQQLDLYYRMHVAH